MQTSFNIEDLFEAIIAIETVGHKNYKRLSAHTEDPQLKRYFTSLAEMELKHHAIFTEMKKSVVHFPTPNLDTDYADYLRSLLANTLRFVKLFEVQMVNPEVFSDFDLAFDLAVGLEKDAILFLTEMKQVLDSSHRPVLNTLIDEERSHLKYLYDYRTSVEETSKS